MDFLIPLGATIERTILTVDQYENNGFSDVELLNRLFSDAASYGAIVALKGGRTYDLNGTELTIPSNLTIIGDGTVTIRNTVGSTDNSINMFYAYEKTNVHVHGVKFVNSRYGITAPAAGVFTGMGCGVVFAGCTNCTVTGCFFEDCGGVSQGVSSIYISSCTNFQAVGNRVDRGLNGANEDNWYSLLSGKGATINSGNLIADNYIADVLGFGLVSDCGATDECAEICGNTVVNSKYAGLLIVQARYVNAHDNYIEMGAGALSTASGIEVRNTTRGRIVDNTIRNAPEHGIHLAKVVSTAPTGTVNVGRMDVTGNDIYDCTGDGIHWVQANSNQYISYCNILNNRLQSCGGRPVNLVQLGGETLDLGNVVRGNVQQGAGANPIVTSTGAVVRENSWQRLGEVALSYLVVTSQASLTTSSRTFSVPGAQPGAEVTVSLDSHAVGAVFEGYCNATSNVVVDYFNSTASALTQPATTIRINVHNKANY